MVFHDLRDFCRLCLMPFGDSCVDCTQEDNREFKEIIKMVYNIDINAVDEFSTKVCLSCCDVLMYNSIHYFRAAEAQKSLTRVQRIKNMLRNLGKKKPEKKDHKGQKGQKTQKDQKAPLPADLPIVDVEMVEMDLNGTKEQFRDGDNKNLPDGDYEMEVTSDWIDNMGPYASDSPFFAGLTSFKPAHGWPPSYDQSYAELSAEPGLFSSTTKRTIEHNNDVKKTPSLFRIAKQFCGTLLKKHKTTVDVDMGIVDITNRLAMLRFSSTQHLTFH